MVSNMPVPMVIIPMVVISMPTLAKKEKIILVTCITRVFKEIITLICLPVSTILLSILTATVARSAFAQNVQFNLIFKRDKLMLRKDPLHR